MEIAMHKRHFIKALAVLFASLALFGLAAGEAAARTRMIHNVVASPLPALNGATMKQISRAIVVAGSRRGWAIRPVGRGRLIATLHIRSHMAEVTITHTRRTFSITYKRSHNLLYRKDGKTEYIHRNYNSWIQFLARDIRVGVGTIR